jgi:predicted DNA-binding transcriptional regulator AlpA
LSAQPAYEDDTPDSPNEPELITVREAARRANIPSRTLYRWIENKTWPVRVFKYSEHVYHVRVDELEAWLAARRAERG